MKTITSDKQVQTVSQSEMEKQLIKMVEERPSLFAVDDKHYTNRRVKTETWRQISEEMNISERELRKKWDSLRTQYGRYRKLPTSGSSAVEKTSRQKWVLRRLRFLEPHLKRERTFTLAHKEPTAPNDTGTGASAVDQWQEEIESEEDLTMPIGESTMSDQETSNTPCTSAEPPLGELTTVSQSEMEEQLIKMVEERPSLFAADDKHYKNLRVKTESWHQISEEMNISERELRKKWDSLRTQYGRYRKLPPSGSSAAEKTSRQKWVLRRLQFLEPHLKRRERTFNKEPTAPNDTGTGASAVDQWQEEIESEEDLTMPIGESAMSDQETSNTPCTSAEPPLGELTTVSQSEMEEQLIKMVEERPSLFAVDDKHYKNRRVKTESWRQISEKMNISERELRKRWDSLRTQYGRYRKLPTSGSSAVEKTSRQKWVLRRLQFLEPHLMRERTLNKEPTAHNDTGTGASVDVRLDDEWQEEIESEDDLTMPISESSMSDLETSNTPCASAEPPAKRSRSFQRDDASESSQGLMRLMGAVLERRSTQQPEDFITVACKCIEHKYRMMPPHLVTRLDHTIQNVIFNFCEEHNVTLQQSSASGQDP